MPPVPQAAGDPPAAPLRSAHVLVTGATGFVGGAVVRALLARGHDVTALVRSPERAGALADHGARLLTGDMLQPESYRDAVDHVDAVIHAAQSTPSGRMTATKVRQIQHADHVMTVTLASACAAAGKRLVYTSGYFNYGDRGDDWITTETPFEPSPLGVGHAAEVQALRRDAASGLDLVVVAPGFVYGPGGLFKSAFWDQARRGRLRCIGDGHSYWSCVHIDDLANGYCAALERAPAGGEYNLVDDAPLRLREFVDLVTDAMQSKRVGTIPPAIMGLIIGKPLVQSLVTSCRVANTEARDQLAWIPAYRAVSDGLPGTVAQLTALDAGTAGR